MGTEEMKNNILESKIYEIDFDGHLKCKIRISDNKLEVEAAMDGWGNKIQKSDISVIELK